MIYYINEKFARFYVSTNYIQNIFQFVYNQNIYTKYYCVYIKLINVVYIKKLIKQLIIYIKQCFKYQLNQTKKYKFYNNLTSIFNMFFLYYTINIDFIIDLLKQNYNCNMLIIIIDKFIKKHFLLFEKTIDLTKQ